jgi:hypothetical protein
LKNEFVLCNAARCRIPKVQVGRPLGGLKLGIPAEGVIIVCTGKEINKNLLHFHGTYVMLLQAGIGILMNW